MRKLTWGAAVSLDLYLAGPDEALDWLLWTKDAAAISGASWQGVDAMLMGRKTYEFVEAALAEARPIAKDCVFLRYRLASAMR